MKKNYYMIIGFDTQDLDNLFPNTKPFVSVGQPSINVSSRSSLRQMRNAIKKMTQNTRGN